MDTAMPDPRLPYLLIASAPANKHRGPVTAHVSYSSR